jgi:hypothetical protein
MSSTVPTWVLDDLIIEVKELKKQLAEQSERIVSLQDLLKEICNKTVRKRHKTGSCDTVSDTNLCKGEK